MEQHITMGGAFDPTKMLSLCGLTGSFVATTPTPSPAPCHYAAMALNECASNITTTNGVSTAGACCSSMEYLNGCAAAVNSTAGAQMQLAGAWMAQEYRCGERRRRRGH